MCSPVLSLIGGLLGNKQSKVSTPAVTTAPAITSGTESLQSEKAAKKKAASAQGYQSTIASGSAGDTSTATTNKKSLLGG